MGRTKQLFEEMRLEQQDFFNKKNIIYQTLGYCGEVDCDNRPLDIIVTG
jgi:hypothetical protein